MQNRRRRSLDGNYRVGRKLGEAPSREVRAAVNTNTGERVAVKIMQKAGLSCDAEIRMRREYTVLQHMDHPNLVRLYDVIENPSELIMVMELAQTDLFTYLTSKLEGHMDEDEAKRIMHQIALGVEYLHSHNFVHRDLKLENILMTDGCMFIADFGFATYWDEDTYTRAVCESLTYTAPEIVNAQPYIGPEVDMWSLGVLLYSMVTGEHPFGGDDEYIKECIVTGDYTIPDVGLSTEVVDLLNRLLTVEAKQRMTIQELLRHEWFV